MPDIVVCDTNVVIQLSIVAPSLLTQKNENLRLVVHTLVKEEVHQLRRDPNKVSRLGPVLDFVVKSVPTDTSLKGFGNQLQEDQQHRRIIAIEQTLPAGKVSAGSSHRDRRFLILAKRNRSKLLTNEGTLYHLSEALIGVDAALRLSDTLAEALSLGLVTSEQLQTGLDQLAGYGERLRFEYAKKLRGLGFNIP